MHTSIDYEKLFLKRTYKTSLDIFIPDDADAGDVIVTTCATANGDYTAFCNVDQQDVSDIYLSTYLSTHTYLILAFILTNLALIPLRFWLSMIP